MNYDTYSIAVEMYTPNNKHTLNNRHQYKTIKCTFAKSPHPFSPIMILVVLLCKDRPGSLFQPGPGPGPGSAKSAGTGILPGPGL